MEFINSIGAIAVQVVSNPSPLTFLALFVITALIDMGIPFPLVLDGVLFTTGYQLGLLTPNLAILLGVLYAGRVCGAGTIYLLARFLDKPVLGRLSRRFPIFRKGLDEIRARLSHRAALSVALGRLTPGLLLPTSVASGGLSLRFDRFILGIALASFVSDMALVLIGFGSAKGFDTFGFQPSFWMMAVAFCGGIALMFVITRVAFRTKKV